MFRTDMQRVKSTYCKKENKYIDSYLMCPMLLKWRANLRVQLVHRGFFFFFLLNATLIWCNLQQLNAKRYWSMESGQTQNMESQLTQKSCSECFDGNTERAAPIMWLVVNQSSCQWHHTLRLICTSFIKTHILRSAPALYIKKNKTKTKNIHSKMSSVVRFLRQLLWINHSGSESPFAK